MNHHSQSLPEPSADALQHSEKLITRIREEIAIDGSISFRRYMEMALYEPALGYYVAGAHKIGTQGDFVTAPEISPLFSQCIANQCKEILSGIPCSSILELGAGTGTMATDILLALEYESALPDHYFILDVSPELKQRQLETIQARAPHLLEKVTWLSQLPADFIGIIIGNEVLDAMPVDVFTQQNKNVFEHHVVWEDGKLCEQLQPANNALSEKVLGLNIPEEATPYTSEINPNLSGWFDTISQCLKAGVILLADYGYPRKEYYLHERNKGTLICHYQHHVNEAPLHYTGLQDITASVDFTAVAEAADEAGLDVLGFTSQVSFLSNMGLENLFSKALGNNAGNKADNDANIQYKLAQQVRILTLPLEMGERFKFIALGKNIEAPLHGFAVQDQRVRL